MIKSLEKFKSFNETNNELNKLFLEIKDFFNDDFINQTNLIFNNFDKLDLNDLENKIQYFKSFKIKIKKFECNKENKIKCLNFIDLCLVFLNDLIMNQIMENI